MKRVARTTVAVAIAVFAIGWLVLAGCGFDKPSSTDAGADPEISQCCDWWIVPLLYDKPQVCLDEHTDEGECRWLTCLGGLVTYHTTGCR